MAITPVYSKLVLPSRKSLEIIINIKIKNIKNINNTKIRKTKLEQKWECPLIRACSLIRSNTVCMLAGVHDLSAISAYQPIYIVINVGPDCGYFVDTILCWLRIY